MTAFNFWNQQGVPSFKPWSEMPASSINSEMLTASSNKFKSSKPSYNHIRLVVSTPLKNISQLGWLFPIFPNIWKNKNVPKHQPDIQPIERKLPSAMCWLTCNTYRGTLLRLAHPGLAGLYCQGFPQKWQRLSALQFPCFRSWLMVSTCFNVFQHVSTCFNP